ncbi:protein AATF-like [Paramacrobiotus metropolitanus]|uniref:protein AATF-like n=1 Tax=Paramacrobiotus metropolitanus TaxID=2943436 RepID=UPI002445BA4B|nr:protein AATF-like [Paramacrobiotus metropolitanus]XP_055349403.1 protein AATF-like [Paramacrobiotus metropolitanus]XP_055349404.1 protein AATF-like [Paramacrobiotus metropolitanus]XP_055349405.1 protein AATF-like [Paramacrobiotus metropolitanus]
MDSESEIASEEYADDSEDFSENDALDGEVTSEDEEGDAHESVKHFAHPLSESRGEAAKGKAVQSQLNLWDGLLETRIKLQKPLAVCNTLPQAGRFKTFVDAADDTTKKHIKTAQAELGQLLRGLVEVQQNLLERNAILTGPDAEEQDGNELDHEFSSALVHPVNSLDVIDKGLTARNAALRNFRNSTLESWHGKTQQFSVGMKRGFSAFEQSPVKHIEQIMGDVDRLVHRTKIRRTAYEVLVSSVVENSSATNDNKKISRAPQSIDQEIFDDDDFYHTLLRELIERKTTGASDDPLEVSRRQVQLAQLRKRTKKLVDSKATRDRKLKMDPHPKLINFMAPQPVCGITEQARNDLFKSVFGKLLSNPPVSQSVNNGKTGDNARDIILLRS